MPGKSDFHFSTASTSRTEAAAVTGRRMTGNATQSSPTDYSIVCVHAKYPVSTLTSVRAVLSHFIQAMLNYPRILDAST